VKRRLLTAVFCSASTQFPERGTENFLNKSQETQLYPASTQILCDPNTISHPFSRADPTDSSGVQPCMLGGFGVFVTGTSRVDWIGKMVLNAAAILWFISVGRDVHRHEGLSVTSTKVGRTA
jgi:hypothetical protein